MDLAPFKALPGPELARQSIPGADGDRPVILLLSRIDPTLLSEQILEEYATATFAQERTGRAPIPQFPLA